ncbi:MAG TPA: DNA-binding protein [Actinomycetota bacterium]|nr:DNA-binding protein [Actinomycetota bacterium]
MPFARKLLKQVSATPQETRAENLRAWASTIEGAVPIAEVEPRCRCRVAGVVQNLRLDPREGHGSIEATIIDGTGQMVAKWLGRSSLSGITLGVGLVIEGTPGTTDGEAMVLNPEYRLVSGPEHG